MPFSLKFHIISVSCTEYSQAAPSFPMLIDTKALPASWLAIYCPISPTNHTVQTDLWHLPLPHFATQNLHAVQDCVSQYSGLLWTVYEGSPSTQ